MSPLSNNKHIGSLNKGNKVDRHLIASEQFLDSVIMNIKETQNK